MSSNSIHKMESTKMKLKYFPELDGVRALAALMVMFFHFTEFTDYSNSAAGNFYHKITVFGQTGVSLFFVLSGFLITRILLNSKDYKGYFQNFFTNRILRIWPLYYFFLICYFLIAPHVFSTPVVPFHEAWYFWFYLQNFAISFDWTRNGPNHFWSLAVEEHFYLFWPFAVYFLSKRNLKYFIFAILVSCLALRVILALHNQDVFYNTFTRMDELALGALLAIFEIDGVFKKANKRKFGVGVLICIAPTVLLWTMVTGQRNAWVQGIKYDLISVIYFCVIGWLLCIDAGNIVKRILNFRFFKFTGKISYGLYVYHPPCFFFFATHFSTYNLFLDVLLAFGISYAVATLSYYLIEIRFLKLKKHFRSQKEIAIEGTAKEYTPAITAE